MSEYTLNDYRNAPSGIGPLASEWDDKPHRLIYDLVARVKREQEGWTRDRDALIAEVREVVLEREELCATSQKRDSLLGNDAARTSLLAYMKNWSKETFAAGWLTDLADTMADMDAEEFRPLVETAGGWYVYRDGPEFVSGTWDELLTNGSGERK